MNKSKIIFMLFAFIIANFCNAQNKNLYYNFINEEFKETYLNLQFSTQFKKQKIKKHEKVNDIPDDFYLSSRTINISFKKEFYDELKANPEEIFEILEEIFSFKKQKLSFANKKINDKYTHQFITAGIKYKDVLVNNLTISISKNDEAKNISLNLFNFNLKKYKYNEQYNTYFSDKQMYDEIEIENVIQNKDIDNIYTNIIYKKSINKYLNINKYDVFKDIYKYAKLDKNEFYIVESNETKDLKHFSKKKYNLLRNDNDIIVANIVVNLFLYNITSAKIKFKNKTNKVYYNKNFNKNLYLPDTTIFNSSAINCNIKKIFVYGDFVKTYGYSRINFDNYKFKFFKKLNETEQKKVIINHINTFRKTNANEIIKKETKEEGDYKITEYAIYDHKKLLNYVIEFYEKKSYMYHNNYIKVFTQYNSKQSYYPKNDTLKSLDHFAFKSNDRLINKFYLYKGMDNNTLNFSFYFNNLSKDKEDVKKALEKIKNILGGADENLVFNKINNKIGFNKMLVLYGSCFFSENKNVEGLKNNSKPDSIFFNNLWHYFNIDDGIEKINNNAIHFSINKLIFKNPSFQLKTNIRHKKFINQFFVKAFKASNLIQQPFDSIAFHRLKRVTGIYGAQDAKSYHNIVFFNNSKKLKTKYVFTFKSNIFSQFDEVNYGYCNYIDSATFNLKYDYKNNDTLKNTKNKLIIENENGFVKNYYHNKKENILELNFDYKKITQKKDHLNSMFQTAYFLMNKNNLNYSFTKQTRFNYFNQYQVYYKNIPITDAYILRASNILKFYYDEELDNLDLPPMNKNETDYKYLIEEWKNTLTKKQQKDIFLNQFKKDNYFITGNQIQYLKHKNKYYLCNVYYVRITAKNKVDKKETQCKRIFIDTQSSRIIKNEFLN